MSDDRLRSVAFDRAADYYDATRVVAEEAARAQTDLLAPELADRGRVLEIGVGTGQVALRLHDAGVPMTGIDLSEPMLRRLLEKSGGVPPFPVVRADATRLPFAAGVFGGVVLRWVLHLIPAWREAVGEIVRVARAGGVVLVNHGGFSGAGRELRERMRALVGRPLAAAGLDWASWEELAAEMARQGAVHRELPPFVEHSEEPLAASIDGIEAGRFSWTWGLDEGERLSAARELRRWAEERFGPLDAPFAFDTMIVWHAYDLPEGARGAPAGC